VLFRSNSRRYDPRKGSLQVWIYRIARNLVIDHYRRKRPFVAIDDVWDLASREDVECDHEVREQIRELKDLLARLPAQQRDIVIMRVWQDLPYREIAGIVGKSEAACKMIFSRVIARLKTALPAMAIFFM
jgi:RNA polymerase sigma-70 factor, ECF subfamily